MTIDPVRLLRDLIACPSVTPELAGVFDVLEQALVPMGFVCTRQRFEGDGSYPVDNLFAIRDRGGRRLLFAGHTDVVPPGDASAWTHPPFSAVQTDDGLIHGRGSADMKSGIAAFIASVSEWIAANGGETGTIALAITNDEEADSVNGTDKLMAFIDAQGEKFDFAIVGEPSSSAVVGDSIKIGRRGSLSGRVVVTGVQGHVAYPERAKNSLPVLAAAVTALSGPRLDAGTAHFPPSNLEFTTIDVGNPTGNVIPASGEARFNIRFNDGWTPDTLEVWIRDRLGEIDAGGCQVVYERLGRPSRSFLSPQSGDVAALGDVIEKLTGKRPEHSTAGGTSDARFIAEYCPVVECGLVGTSMHKVDEAIRHDDLIALTVLYRNYLGVFFGANH